MPALAVLGLYLVAGVGYRLVRGQAILSRDPTTRSVRGPESVFRVVAWPLEGAK